MADNTVLVSGRDDFMLQAAVRRDNLLTVFGEFFAFSVKIDFNFALRIDSAPNAVHGTKTCLWINLVQVAYPLGYVDALFHQFSARRPRG